jgi:hypothetical protein
MSQMGENDEKILRKSFSKFMQYNTPGFEYFILHNSHYLFVPCVLIVSYDNINNRFTNQFTYPGNNLKRK